MGNPQRAAAADVRQERALMRAHLDIREVRLRERDRVVGQVVAHWCCSYVILSAGFAASYCTSPSRLRTA